MGLSRSTYYYHIANRNILRAKCISNGRPIAGYSLNTIGKKICDEEIKEYIIEAIQDEAMFYGYRKITYHLRNSYSMIINHKKVYRLCKELGILRKQRVIKPKVVSRISVNRVVTRSNELWEADIKYGYIMGECKFFFVLSVIDVFDRSIIGYHIGYRCESTDAVSLLKRCLLKRELFNEENKPVIRTDNGPQFVSNLFEESCMEINICHERIPCRTPNKNAHIESFHRIFEDECIGIHEFTSFKHAYGEVAKFMKRYNTARIHSSLKYRTPNGFYELNKDKEVSGMAIHL